VKDAIQGESRKQGTDIYCDWTGSARQALQLDRGTSNVVLYDRAGRVAFSASGALSEARREELVRLLRSYVE
jgi:predicted transcriptional regulator